LPSFAVAISRRGIFYCLDRRMPPESLLYPSTIANARMQAACVVARREATPTRAAKFAGASRLEDDGLADSG
jgi:hypothetical protein